MFVLDYFFLFLLCPFFFPSKKKKTKTNKNRDDCEYVNDEILKHFAKLRDVLAAAQKDDVESEEMQVLQNRFQDIVESRMQGELRSLKSETTKCGNSKEKKEWKTLLKEHRDKLKKMQHDLHTILSC